MWKVAIALACLVCIPHGRRGIHRPTLSSTKGTTNSVQALNMLILALRPSVNSPSILNDHSSVSRLPMRSIRIATPQMQLGDALQNFLGGGRISSAALVDTALGWEELRSKLEETSNDAERRFREELFNGRAERACSLASRRLFDLPEGEAPRVVFYRDTAAWCPYCEKVWMVLEEKRVPYEVQKVNMNCYGDKPSWFWTMQPSGGIPVVKLDGNVIRESNDIIMEIERTFTQNPLLPSKTDLAYERVSPLLQLERELFSLWFRWLTSPLEFDLRKQFEGLLRRVDDELAVEEGPFFLGSKLSLVDCMFSPFLERMAASLAYYKGLTLRRNENWPRIEEWFLAMEARPSYRHIQSDFYTHVKDLPPQIGPCFSTPEAKPYADAIDGLDGSWSLPLPDDDGLLQPLSGLEQSQTEARREAAERVLANHENIVTFAARGLSGPSLKPVSAPLSDPHVKVNKDAIPIVDVLLRHVVHTLLDGPEAVHKELSSGIEPRTAEKSLGYLRDRISVPRDMSYPAARQLRAHLNHVTDAIRTAGR